MRVLVALTVLVAGVLAGCMSSPPAATPESVPETGTPDLAAAVFNATGSWSWPLQAPKFDRLPAVVEKVAGAGGTMVEIGIFRPKMPGCPEDLKGEFPPECKTPVIIDSGPYYTPTSISKESTRPPIAIWFVPHGYTVVQMAVRGTGGSDGCMEFMSLNEQKDVDAVVTDVAKRPWSTGNVAMMGRSYDGTTPFMAAALGNPHLKTIVPISGVADVPELMFSNGTSEFRGSIMHSYVYWLNYGIQPESSDSKMSQVCPEVLKGALAGPYTAATGDWDMAGQDDYWTIRQFRQRILDNYNGSMFIVHGMQDWNVNPRMVVPWINELQDKGIRVKAWLGQWGHAYPDRPDEHPNVRWDWAETLLRWFDHELKGAAVDTGPIIEVEDHRHQWWIMDSYPARDLERLVLNLNGDGSMTSQPGAGGSATLLTAGGLSTVQSVSLVSEPLAGPVRISGLVKVPLKVTPLSPSGGNVYLDLYDVYPDGRAVWLGQGWINLRYHAGTTEAQTLVPGTPVTAMMQLEPLEGYLGDGHRVRLTIRPDADFVDQYFGVGNADLMPQPTGSAFTVHFDGGSKLELPLLRDFRASPYATYKLSTEA